MALLGPKVAKNPLPCERLSISYQRAIEHPLLPAISTRQANIPFIVDTLSMLAKLARIVQNLRQGQHPNSVPL